MRTPNQARVFTTVGRITDADYWKRYCEEEIHCGYCGGEMQRRCGGASVSHSCRTRASREDNNCNHVGKMINLQPDEHTNGNYHKQGHTAGTVNSYPL